MSHARRVRFDVPVRGPQFEMAYSASNRRNNERHVPTEDRAWLGWWEGSVFRTAEAVLQNISKGGVLVSSALQPPRRANVWICLDGPRRTEWVEGKVLDVGRDELHIPLVRIKFDEICPYAFFEVAVYGWNAARPAEIHRGPKAAYDATCPSPAMTFV